MGRIERRVLYGTIVAASAGAAALLGVATGVVVWTLRRMSVGSVGGNRDRYDVYFDLMRQAQTGTHEA